MEIKTGELTRDGALKMKDTNQEWEASIDSVSGEWWVSGLDNFVHGSEEDTDEDVAAKAHMAAAAPEMLAALKAVARDLGDGDKTALCFCTRNVTFFSTHTRGCVMANAAIAKATAK